MAKKKDQPVTIQTAAKLLTDAAHFRYDLSELFRDFVSITAISLQNGFEPKSEAWEAREAEYHEIVKGYDREVIDAFASCMGAIMLIAQRDGYGDQLGTLYMALGTGKKGLGQFFTPYHISQAMAAMAMNKDMVEQAIAEKGYIAVGEPTCGAGGMVVAAAEAITNLGYRHQDVMRCDAQDLDRVCCRMTYIACCLHQIPARIIWGDTLKMEQRTIDLTPALWLQMARMRLQEAA